ncbi:MAG: T9SS type A sorting domain-containing protein, partial [Bacteroidetes bacterium]|nr:T9SS type A sorting domain-containing protein [Bacteroidota bacterium]
HSLDITSFDCDDIGTHTVTLTATDVHGNSNTCNATVTVVGAVPSCTITSSANTSGNVIGSTTTYAATNQMFLGYGPQSMNISCSASGGNSFSYSWSGSGLSSTNVSNPVFTPSQGGNYTLTCTVTNDYGCETTCSITICVIDVQASGGSAKNPKVIVCHVPAGNKGNPQTISISVNAVSAHLGYHGGCTLGPCGYDCDDNKNYKRSVANADIHHMEGADQDIELMVFPNPSHDGFNLLLESPDDDLMTVAIYDISGRLILDSDQVQPNDVFEFGDKFPVGVYVVRVNQNSATKTIRIIKTDQ